MSSRMAGWVGIIALLTTLDGLQAQADDTPLIRLPVGVQGPKLLKPTSPAIPPSLLERMRSASGVVFLDCVIGEGGQVEDVAFLAGAPDFREAAELTVRQWVFEPPIHEGRPVRLAVAVSMYFVLSPDPVGRGIAPIEERLTLRALKDSNALVREVAARELARRSGKAAVDPLLRVLADENPRVREAAAIGLGEVGKVAVERLLKVLAADDPRVREAAAMALGRVGRDAQKAIPALQQASADADPGVRNAAAKALAAIGPD